ncbi:TPA: DUF4123 domain-containing protein [Yersinia enterocolitica]
MDMMTDTGAAWIKQAEALCTAAGQDYVDVLVDQAGTEQPLQNALRQLSPAIRWLALFDDTPEAGTTEYSPILMRLHFPVSNHRGWLEQLVEHFAGTPRLTLLISPLSFDLLSRHLQVLSQVLWEEQTGLLRYYDNRIFSPLYDHVLTPDQQAAFTDIALFWSWRNRDGAPTWKAGTWIPERVLADEPEMSRVNDAQVAMMGCISDAEALRKELPAPDMTREAHFARCMAIALQANEAGYLGSLLDFKE